ncbi:MAG: hypothetical protein QXW97_04495 [Candidatus Pacearchaeota archaeon]
MVKKKNKSLDRKKILSILAFIVLGIFLMPRIIYPNVSGNVIYSGGEVNKENFASYLEQQQIIKDLPKNGLINLKLYKNENGQKIFEESFIITKGRVVKGESNKPDAIIYLNSNYIKDNDFCSTIKSALENNDLEYELKKSEFFLTLKYSGMLKYKNCFGL